jgi:hypothetical protein
MPWSGIFLPKASLTFKEPPMPKNKVSDPITDQEIAFARLVLSGAMTDRQAAEAVGLNPDSAAYTKSKPRVRDYMLEHRAAVQQQLVQQEADLSRRAVEGQYRFNPDREQVLKRLWELANLSPEMTRSSITGQVKAISMIVAMQNFIPDRRAVPSEKNSAPASAKAEIYASAWLRKQQTASIDPQPTPAEEKAGQGVPACPGTPWKPELAPTSAQEAPPNPGPSQSTFANPLSPSQASPVAPYGPGFSFVPDATGPFAPDTRAPFSIKKNPFARPR